MAFLLKQGKWQGAPSPNLILLDLNLPRKDGREVLQEIKKNPSLCTIPVVVMTTSAAERDVLNAYSLHASSYIVKPLNLDQFLNVMNVLGDYWFQVVRLPGYEQVKN